MNNACSFERACPGKCAWLGAARTALLSFLALGLSSAMALTSTTTALTSSVNPSYVSQNTTLTAT